MKYKLEYELTEYIYGKRTIIIVLSNSLQELFDANVDCERVTALQCESVKQKITDDGKFFADELAVSINTMDCKTEADKRLLVDLLKCKNPNYNYFIVVYFDSEIESNVRFIGKFVDKITEDQFKWSGELFNSSVIDVESKYRLTAISLDIGILEAVKLMGEVKKEDGTIITNIYERLKANNWQLIRDIAENKKAYSIYQWNGNNYDTEIYYTPLVNLYRFVNLLLELTSEILYELLNINFTFELQETILPFLGSPTGIELRNNYSMEISKVYELNKLLRLRFGNVAQSGESVVYIYRKAIHSEIGELYYESNIEEASFVRNEIATELNYCLLSYDNIADLLIALSKSLGCKLIIRYTSNNVFVVKFVPLANIKTDDEILIAGTTSLNLETESVLIEEGAEYYGQMNKYTAEGLEFIRMRDDHSYELEQTDKVKLMVKEKKERTAITIGIPIIRINDFLKNVAYCLLLNCSDFVKLNNFPWNIQVLKIVGAKVTHLIREYTANNLLCEFVTDEEWMQNITNNLNVVRPVYAIYYNYRQELYRFDSINEYLNRIYGRDKYYELIKGSAVVPFYSGFKKGLNTNWNCLQIGDKIRYKFNRWVYDLNGLRKECSELLMLINTIEIDLRKPLTKIEFIQDERFNYDLDGIQNTEGGEMQDDEFTYNYEVKKVAIGETIGRGEFVEITRFTDEIYRANAYYNINRIPFGIALENGSNGSMIKVQTNGIVEIGAEKGFSKGDIIYVRMGQYNLSNQVLEGVSENENCIYVIGFMRNDKELELYSNYERYLLDGGSI